MILISTITSRWKTNNYILHYIILYYIILYYIILYYIILYYIILYYIILHYIGLDGSTYFTEEVTFNVKTIRCRNSDSNIALLKTVKILAF